MRKPLFLIFLLLMAFAMAAVGQVAQAPDRQKKYDEEDKQRERDYYQAYLKGCKTNEIRTLWFLYHERQA